jgi:hypothetical protein
MFSWSSKSLNCVLSRLGWLSLIIMYSRVSYCYYYLNLTGYVTFNITSYFKDAAVVLTVHWIANPPVPVRYTVYHTVVVYLLTKEPGMISSVRFCFSLHLLVTIDSIKYRSQYKYILITTLILGIVQQPPHRGHHLGSK